MLNKYNYFITEDSKYEAQILQNNNFDYYTAQTYYKQAKTAMLNSLAAETQSGMMSKTIDLTAKELEWQIMQAANSAAASTSDTLESAKIALNEISDLVSSSANTLSLKRAITKATKAAEETLTKKEQKEYRNFSSTFTSRVKSMLPQKALNTIEDMLKTTKYYSGASELVKSNLRNYLLRNLIQQSLLRSKSDYSITTATTKYAQAVGGYFKEEAVVNAFNNAGKKIQNISSNKKMPQAIDIGMRNLPSDFLIGYVLDEKEINQLCSTNFKGVSESQLITPELQQSFIDSIPIFGAQIKSYNLLNMSGNLVKPYYPIGARASLVGGLVNSKKYLYGYSMAANMAYMGQKHNIITALGVNNVMFIAGTKAYWMDEFIEEFRQKKMYLSLDTKGKTLDTFQLTAHVSLLKYSNSLMLKMFTKDKTKTMKFLDNLENF